MLVKWVAYIMGPDRLDYEMRLGTVHWTILNYQL